MDLYTPHYAPLDLVCKHISMLFRYIQAAMAGRLEPLGIGMGQYPHLLATCERPGISQDKLTGNLLYNKSSVARALISLEENGFLRRETDPADKRAYRLYPTEKGLAAKEVIRRQVTEVTAELTQGFAPDERQQAALLLQRMAENATNLRVGPAEERSRKPADRKDAVI